MLVIMCNNMWLATRTTTQVWSSNFIPSGPVLGPFHDKFMSISDLQEADKLLGDPLSWKILAMSALSAPHSFWDHFILGPFKSFPQACDTWQFLGQYGANIRSPSMWSGNLHRSGNASQGLEMLRHGTWHAERLLLCDQHVVQNTICLFTKMGPMGEQQVRGWVGNSNAPVVWRHWRVNLQVLSSCGWQRLSESM